MRRLVRVATIFLALIVAAVAGSTALADTTILSEGFESAFPIANGWVVTDADPDGVTAYWAAVNWDFGWPYPHAGNYMGYCAGVGYDGTYIDPLYRDDMESSMTKTIDLTGFITAQLSFWYIIPSLDEERDWLEVTVDGYPVKIPHTEIPWRADTVTPVWTNLTIDLSTVGVWWRGTHKLSFVFHSDALTHYEGAYLDDILVTGVHSLTKPTGLTASNGTWTSQVMLDWDVVPYADYYIIYRNTSNNILTADDILLDKNTLERVYLAANAYADASVTPMRRYYYWVQAANTGTTSAASTPAIGYAALAPPADVQASDGAFTDKVHITWIPTPGTTHFCVERATASDAVRATISGWIAGTPYYEVRHHQSELRVYWDDTTAVPKVPYYYWVKARNLYGESLTTSDDGYRAEGVTVPTAVTCRTACIVGEALSFRATGAVNNLAHPVQCQFDWGDDTALSAWNAAAQSHTFAALGTYPIKARARCATDTSVVSDWSDALAQVDVVVEAVTPPTHIIGTPDACAWDLLQFKARGAESNVGHALQHQFDWGDGTFVETASWGDESQTHKYGGSGAYDIKVRARCASPAPHPAAISAWSDVLLSQIVGTVKVQFSAATSRSAPTVASVNIPVSLPGISPDVVTVDYAYIGGTADNDDDPLNGPRDCTVNNTGTLTFTPGETEKNITVALVTTDTLPEGDETVILQLSDPVNATLGPTDTHTFTISRHNDPKLKVRTPNGGESLPRGAKYTITWSRITAARNWPVRITLWYGSIYVREIVHSASNRGATSKSTTAAYSWSVSNSITPSSRYRIRVELLNYPTFYDASDAGVTIK